MSDVEELADILDMLREFSAGVEELEYIVVGLNATKDELVDAIETLQARMVVDE